VRVVLTSYKEMTNLLSYYYLIFCKVNIYISSTTVRYYYFQTLMLAKLIFWVCFGMSCNGF
jgi:hypothetical protein